jgi:hypothetical protein
MPHNFPHFDKSSGIIQIVFTLLIGIFLISLMISLKAYNFSKNHQSTSHNNLSQSISEPRESTPAGKFQVKAEPAPEPTSVPKPIHSWSTRSVSSMKETKDRICQQRSSAFITKWVLKAKELGANYVSIETPYENPGCGSSISYTKSWVDAIRTNGLNVWHRHMPLGFEGIYDNPKTVKDYLPLIADYIKANPSFFAPGDIFTPIPEPQNGGISGVSYCANSICQFQNKENFNAFLRNAITVSSDSFAQIGLSGQVKIGYYGLDGFIVWGDNNPDWEGIIEDSTIAKMGNLTIDHYPEAVGDTMENDLKELTTKYPNTPIIIGEWGTIGSGNFEQMVKNTMGAAIQFKNVVGFNYWHMGVGGLEALIEEDFTNKSHFDEVQSYFRR